MRLKAIARARVPLGFLCAAAALALAAPSRLSWLLGGVIALAGEATRVWAAGHIEKGREITQSGPYRYVRHPLYLGSALIGAGFAIAARSPVVIALTVAYLGITLMAAMHTEERALDEKFDGAYSEYRSGRLAPATRRFSAARAWRNREYRALLGLVVAFSYLAWRLASI